MPSYGGGSGGGLANANLLPNGKYVPMTNDLTGKSFDPNTNLLSNYYSKAIYGNQLKLNKQGQVQEVVGQLPLSQDDLTYMSNQGGGTTMTQLEQNQFIANANEVINKQTDPLVKQYLNYRLDTWKHTAGIIPNPPNALTTRLNPTQMTQLAEATNKMFPDPTFGRKIVSIPTTTTTTTTNPTPSDTTPTPTTTPTTTPATTTPATTAGSNFLRALQASTIAPPIPVN